MKQKIHMFAGMIALLTITIFWLSTVAVELVGTHEAIAGVKQAILWGMIVLIPSMMMVGGSGASLAQGRSDTLVLRKKRRMPIVALNGMLILLPSAVFLAKWSAAGDFGTIFILVQALELVAGLTNITLLSLNMRDGLKLTGKIKQTAKKETGQPVTSSISFGKDGPIIIQGLSEIVNDTGASIAVGETAALCRCGHSKNKPFCDHSHVAAGFSEQKLDDRTKDERRDYQGNEITIHYNRLLCSRAGFCSRDLPEVFRHGQDPWANPDSASMDDIKDLIERCPSGALSYSIKGEMQSCENRLQVIRIEKDGPYHIEGAIPLGCEDWGDGASKEHYSLCSCGKSKNKPFCDGSHR